MQHRRARKCVVEALARRLLGGDVHVHAVRLGGKDALPWVYASALRLLEGQGDAYVVVVVDADSAISEEVERQKARLEEQLRMHHLAEDTTVCIAVPTLEAW